MNSIIHKRMELIRLKCIVVGVLAFCSFAVNATNYHVSKTGSNGNSGTYQQPFKSITRAASVAQPGDTITVHAGVYREWVSPAFGGLNNQTRIVYQAAPGEEVWIKGSEVIKSWKHYQGNVWKVVLSNDFFGDFNPYQELLNGDWLITTYGRNLHLGEVYLNGSALYETDSLKNVFNEKPMERARDTLAAKYKWYCESDDDSTTIYANFRGVNPNKEEVEINVRPAVFFPKRIGINYITVRGFKLAQAATQWAPPTAEQIGLIGPNWSKGWVIEDNLICNSKCSGISLGKDRASGQNEWSRVPTKHGTQREREVVFKALQLGWSKETIGSHLVRNNIIRDCGQAGIVGHLGCVFSEISNNQVYNIGIRGQFFGYEMAGIKLHAAIDVLLKNNCVHDNHRGIWLDWQAQGARVTGNLLFNNSDNEDLFVEVNHGPLMVDNNILLSNHAILDASQGTAFVHNLIAGSIQTRAASNRFTPYHFAHSTKVMGLMTVLLGDDRFYNNIFACNSNSLDKNQFSGLNAFNDFPPSTYKWEFTRSLNHYNRQKLPVFIAANLYLNKALPSNIETNYVENRSLNPAIELVHKNETYYLNINVDASFNSVQTFRVDTDLLGTALESEAPFENSNGSPILFDRDYLGQERNTEHPMVGPFEDLQTGKNTIELWQQGHPAEFVQ